MTENQLSFKVIGAAIEVHKILGAGLLESSYEIALEHELKLIGLDVQKQVPIDVLYKGIHLEKSYKIDMIVNQVLLIEIKSVVDLAPVFFSQTLTYLKHTNLKLGLLINFNETILKNGVHRVVNKLVE
jgi:GxxExxY protein